MERAVSCMTRRTLCTKGVIGGGREGSLELRRALGVAGGGGAVDPFESAAAAASGAGPFDSAILTCFE